MSLHVSTFIHHIRDVVVENNTFHKGKDNEYHVTVLRVNTIEGEMTFFLYPEEEKDKLVFRNEEGKEYLSNCSLGFCREASLKRG